MSAAAFFSIIPSYIDIENIQSSCRAYLPICSSGLKPNNGPGATDIATFNTISGTSMAAPHIAGIIAQLFQANPDATPAQVEAAMKATAYKYTNGDPYTAVRAFTSRGTRAPGWWTSCGGTGARRLVAGGTRISSAPIQLRN